MPCPANGLGIGTGWVVAVNINELDSGLGLQAVSETKLISR